MSEDTSASLAAVQRERIAAVVTAILDASGAPGAAVAVVSDGACWAQGFGVRELGRDALVDEDTLFVCASTTKAFTTTLIACLVDDKRLGWDDPVRKWLPGLRFADPHADALVTIRDLVTHRTGLPRHDGLWYHSALGADEVLRRAGFAPPSATFRGTYQYQNICYLAAGRVAVAAANARDFETLLRERLLARLAMTRSPLTWAGMEAESNRVEGHQRIKGALKVTPRVNFDSVEGAGAMHTSARQMLNWLHLHLSGGLAPDGTRVVAEERLRETYQAQMVQPVEADSLTRYPTCDPMTYGLGWSVWHYPLWGVRGNRAGVRMLSHGGYLDGFRAHVALVPSEQIGVAVFANLSGPLIESLRSAVLDVLLDLAPNACPNWADLVRGDVQKAEDENAKKKADADEKRKTALPPPLPLSAFVGRYTHDAYGEATVLEDDQLILQWNGNTSPLRHEQYTTFTAITDKQPLEDETVHFTVSAEGAVSHLVLWDTPLCRVKPSQAGATPADAGEPLTPDAASENRGML